MNALNQKTVRKAIHFDGIGLHNGKKVSISIKPAEPNTGITFKRTDLIKNNSIVPNVFNVTNASYCTTITNENNVSVSTIEHLMAALFGVGVDNALIEIDNAEVPILDGSAKEFVQKLIGVGLQISQDPIKIIKVIKKVEIQNGEKKISIEPSKLSLNIDFELKYQNPTIGNQRNIVKVYEDDLSDIFFSRTFCLFEDIEKIKKNGLAKGGSLDNAIVVKDKEILNVGGLRNDKEFVNHKILDCIGDLYTSGYRVLADVKCSQGGHYLTNELLRKLFNDKENFALLEIKEKTLPHTFIQKNPLKSIA